MIDKSIPYFNVLMRYDGPPVLSKPAIPDGFFLSVYRSGDEKRWAQMELDNNDFDTYENGVSYFSKKYLTNIDKLKERFIGVRDKNDTLIGCVICWDDYREDKSVSSVHWLVTDPTIQGRGIGTFLVSMLLFKFSELGLLPVYLHTQPWSYQAIGIYSNLGFKLLKTDSFKEYENQTSKALPILKKYMDGSKYLKLIEEMI